MLVIREIQVTTFEIIKTMKIRGAPAIGVAGAYGVYLGIRKSNAKDFRMFNGCSDKVKEPGA